MILMCNQGKDAWRQLVLASSNWHSNVLLTTECRTHPKNKGYNEDDNYMREGGALN